MTFSQFSRTSLYLRLRNANTFAQRTNFSWQHCRSVIACSNTIYLNYYYQYTLIKSFYITISTSRWIKNTCLLVVLIFIRCLLILQTMFIVAYVYVRTINNCQF